MRSVPRTFLLIRAVTSLLLLLSAACLPSQDLWSIGVVLYVVLSGTPAFANATLDEAVSSGAYRPMKGKRWSNVSDKGKDLVRRLLVVDPRKRLTANEARDHPWLASAGAESMGRDTGKAKAKAKTAPTVEGGPESSNKKQKVVSSSSSSDSSSSSSSSSSS